MDKLISSPQIRKQAADISPENLETFLYIDIDIKYYRHTSFTWALLCICVDDLDTIMNKLDTMGNNDILL